MADIYKGPYIITRFSENYLATIRTPHGTKVYNYNTQMFKLFHPEKEEKKEEKSSSEKNKKNFRQDEVEKK